MLVFIEHGPYKNKLADMNFMLMVHGVDGFVFTFHERNEYFIFFRISVEWWRMAFNRMNILLEKFIYFDQFFESGIRFCLYARTKRSNWCALFAVIKYSLRPLIRTTEMNHNVPNEIQTQTGVVFLVKYSMIQVLEEFSHLLPALFDLKTRVSRTRNTWYFYSNPFKIFKYMLFADKERMRNEHWATIYHWLGHTSHRCQLLHLWSLSILGNRDDNFGSFNFFLDAIIFWLDRGLCLLIILIESHFIRCVFLRN